MTVVVSVSAVVVTLTLGWLAALRAQYERVLDVLRYISSDKVASARHQLGLVIYQSQPQQSVDADSRPDRVNDLFIALWAFSRIDAIRRTLPRWNLPVFFDGGPLLLLKSNTEPWVSYWHRHLAIVLTALGPDVDTSGSDEALSRLAAVRLKQ